MSRALVGIQTSSEKRAVTLGTVEGVRAARRVRSLLIHCGGRVTVAASVGIDPKRQLQGNRPCGPDSGIARLCGLSSALPTSKALSNVARTSSSTVTSLIIAIQHWRDTGSGTSAPRRRLGRRGAVAHGATKPSACRDRQGLRSRSSRRVPHIR
jgi:hypothetical protein